MYRNLLTVALVLAVSASAHAQEGASADGLGPDAGSWELILAGSGSNDKDFDNGSGNINAEVGYYLHEDWAVGVRQSLGIVGGNNDSWDASTAVFVDWHFWDIGSLRPFVGASLGYLYGDDDVVDETGTAGLEAGAKWYVKDEAFIYGRMSYDFFFDDSDDVDDGFDDGRVNYVVGIGLNF